ncbi:MAG: PKD domain-containing protein [Thermoplasmata archaeon]|nr:PKD domain-containing protein [Thermoplasmata archaeon]
MKACAWLLVVAILVSTGCMGSSEDGDDNEAPIAELSIEKSVVNLGEEVEFDGAVSTDDNRIVKYMFWFGDRRSSGETTTPVVTHIYDEPGEMTITLAVWDDKGVIGLDTGSLIVNAPPEANMSITRGSVPTTDAWVGETLTFSGSDSSDQDGYIRHFIWDFGDESNSTLEEDTHVYNAEGTYDVTLIVEDQHGARDIATATIEARLHRYKAVWNHSEELQIYSDNWYVTETDPTWTHEENITHDNLTRIWFNLTWTDTEYLISGQDEFQLSIETPFGDDKQEVDIDEEIGLEWIFTFDGDPYPTNRDIYAPTIEDARTIANAMDMTTSKGTGEYNINVTITGGTQFIIDEGNFFHIEVWFEYYYGDAWVEEIE